MAMTIQAVADQMTAAADSIKSEMKNVTAQNAATQQEVHALRREVAELKEQIRQLAAVQPAAPQTIDTREIMQTLSNVIQTTTTAAVADIQKQSRSASGGGSSSDDTADWIPKALAGAAAVLVFGIFAMPFIAVHTSGNIDTISDIKNTTDRILWNQGYSWAKDENGEQELVTPFTPQSKFARWWNNQQNYLENLNKPQP